MPRHLNISLTCALLLCLLAGAGSCLFGQDEKWLAAHKQNDPVRYEGFVDQPNAQREYEIRSFMAFAGAPPADLFIGMPSDLHVGYCTSATAGQPAFIEVRQLITSSHYLMKVPERKDDAAKPRLVDFSWPTKDVIQPGRISPNDLGVVVRLGKDAEYVTDLAPAIFSTTAQNPLRQIDHYSLSLLVQGNKLDDLTYTVHAGNGAEVTCRYQNDLKPCVNSPRVLPSPIERNSLVHLSFELPESAAGPALLHVQGHYHDSDEMLSADFHFLHQPVCK
jgi:hypothetical protein